MKKLLFSLIMLPLLGFSQEKWSLGLIELSRQGDSAYSSLLLKSMETSLQAGGQYQVRVYEDRQALFKSMDVRDGGQRKDLLNLASRLEHEFLISGEYIIQGEDIYILLYAVDNAYQKVKYMKSYTGKTDADIFDLIEKIAGDFSEGLRKALPPSEPGVIIEYRKKLKVVSSAKKFPRTMIQSYSMEMVYLKGDYTSSATNASNIDSTFVQAQAYLNISFFAERWYFGITGPILPLSYTIIGNDYVQGINPITRDIRPQFWIGYAFLDRLYLSLGIGMRVFRVNGLQSGANPHFCFTPLFSYTPNRHWKLDMSPVNLVILDNGLTLKFYPIYLNAQYFINETWGIQAYMLGTYLERGPDMPVQDGGIDYTGTEMGLSLGLGLSYRLGIDS